MSSSRYSSRRNGQGTTSGTVTDAVEPLGKVRRSQIISTYGIGAIVDLEKGSFMPMGLEDWEAVTRLPSLTIGEARLQAQLGVTHFRLPPIAEETPEHPGLVNARHTAPAVRFPLWHECPQCHRIGTENEPFVLADDGMRLECRGHSKPVITNPVRLVVACRRGHIEDFPWIWWAHRDKSACEHPQLELRSAGRSAALSDLIVTCKYCHSYKSLGDAFRPESMLGRRCGGLRPWLYDREKNCPSTPRILQRGASNTHFAVVASALSIPPVSEATFQIIEGNWMVLGALPAEAVDPVLKNLAEQYGIPVDALHSAYKEKKNIEGHDYEITNGSSRSEEYLALSQDRNDPVIGGIVPEFCNTTSEPPKELEQWFDLVGSVSRLREVRALAGFSRIEPYPVSIEAVSSAINQGLISPLSKSPKNWLPAAEIRGEGIFLRFRNEAIEQWLSANPDLQKRVASLEKRSAALAMEHGYQRDYEITARLLLVHSFSHAMIRSITIDCGYSSSALRERLYISEPDGQKPAMSGVLIYTGSSDSDGSLGGLVRLAEPEQLIRIIRRTLSSAEWCGSDPVCLETDPDQSGERISGAACHCCLLTPETACEKFNRELDRTMLVGSAETLEGESWSGFFEDMKNGDTDT